MSKTPTSSAQPYSNQNQQAQASAGSGLMSNLPQQQQSSSQMQGATTAGARMNIPPKRSQNHNKARKGRALYPDSDAYTELALTNGSTTSRRGQVDISHLLNFSLPPRQEPQVSHLSRGLHGRGRKAPPFGLGSGYHPSDKARFVNANYRFIVDPKGDYRAQIIDPDVHLDWKDITQVLASPQTQSTNCPICLADIPIAPRMAKCGHIFCLPCLLRYLATDDNGGSRAKWKKCPICWDSVYLFETRPLKWYDGATSELPKEGGDVLMRLLKRHPGTTLALPRDGADVPCKPDEQLPPHYAAEVFDYARVMKGTAQYMRDEYTREAAELEVMQKEDEFMFGEEGMWTEKAVRKVNSMVDDVHVESNNGQDEKHAPVPEPSSPLLSLEESYHFYRARNAAHYYLSPLDIRILRTAFGSYATFPSTLLVHVERISGGHIVDHDLRKRVRYLAHLPAGCEVAFLECDWSDVVKPDILRTFHDEIERRRKRNVEKQVREERDRVRAERESERLLAVRTPKDTPRKEAWTVSDFVSLEPESPSLVEPGSVGSTISLASTPPKTIWGTPAVASLVELTTEEEHEEEESGWLEGWEDEVQVSGPSTPQSGKKKKKVVLMSNGGRRGYT